MAFVYTTCLAYIFYALYKHAPFPLPYPPTHPPFSLHPQGREIHLKIIIQTSITVISSLPLFIECQHPPFFSFLLSMHPTEDSPSIYYFLYSLNSFPILFSSASLLLFLPFIFRHRHPSLPSSLRHLISNVNPNRPSSPPLSPQPPPYLSTLNPLLSQPRLPSPPPSPSRPTRPSLH